jgi:hypothetical protein
MTAPVRALVALEGDASAGAFPAIVTGRRNGWAVPAFDRATVDAILASGRFTLESGRPALEWRGQELFEASEADVATEWHAVRTVNLEGAPLWLVGDGWIWDDVAPPCEHCAWSPTHRMHYCEADEPCGHYCAGHACPWAIGGAA